MDLPILHIFGNKAVSAIQDSLKIDNTEWDLTDSKDCYSKTCVKQPLSKRQKIGFQYQLSLNAGQKYC